MARSPAERMETARCPRCGYDQRGVVATWTDACPLEGTCTECGLRFSWAEVVRPDKFEPRWCVEYRPGRFGALRAAPATLFRSVVPWRFWSRIEMSHRIRPGRLAIYVLLLLLLLVVAYVIEQSAVAISVRYNVERHLNAYPQQINAQITSIQRRMKDPSWQTLSAQDRRSIQTHLVRLQAMQGSPPRLQYSYPAAVVDAVFTPWASRSRATVTGARGMWVWYPPPRSIHEEAGRIGDGAEAVGAALLWQIVAFALLPIGFIALPISRRRAKVRWAHVTRVAIYGLFIPVVAVAVVVIVGGVALAVNQSIDGLPLAVLSIVALLFTPAVILWWAIAITCYLRMRHGWAVALLLAVIALLLPVAAVMLPVWFEEPWRDTF